MESKTNRIAALSILFLISAATFTAAQPPQARKQQPPIREQRTGLPKIVTIHGNGKAAPRTNLRVMRVTEPTPLSANEKRMLLNSVGVKSEVNSNDSFKLTPAMPYQPQGSLSFTFPAVVNCGDGSRPYANFVNSSGDDPMNRAVVLTLSVRAGKKYLIDFSVVGSDFSLTTSDGTKETFSGTNHVLIAYEPASNTKEHFYLSSTAEGWDFFSCEVTTLN